MSEQPIPPHHRERERTRRSDTEIGGHDRIAYARHLTRQRFA